MPNKQNYSEYTDVDFKVWNLLFKNQAQNIKGKAHPEYLASLEKLNDVLNAENIPHFDNLNRFLSAENGWTVEVVPGLIPVNQFFKFLSNRKFCSSTWMRSMKNLEYLEEPDMFHDIFGHIPLLVNDDYANFVQYLGRLGVKYSSNELVLKQLQRLYWFTIEFGLIRFNGEVKVYGAGILSSSGESKHIFEDEIEVLPFDLLSILHEDFKISEIQNRYYIIESFNQLFGSVSDIEYILSEY